MKKLLTALCMIFLTIITAQQSHSQIKLSKEETVEYINKILSISLGKYKSDPNESFWAIEEQSFSLDKVAITKQVYAKDSDNGGWRKSCKFTDNISQIPWETLQSVSIDTTLKFELGLINLLFKTSSREELITDCHMKEFDGTKIYTPKEISLYVTKDKAENVKKAFLHLKELMYKKDPFE
ncbi:hypothetical protein [Rhizosphaericola mali]|uniref:Uncharacterized protein n=1 Tax=Rhizosphaericola mali TaxID=2545455 RepID=A0A5P2G135_9BACT|nr:hypothetical protein [Rhizosphaericola mali]QES89514.1 hypothetical protein E0W69_012865 [Rhizosphaericola mali]